MFERVLDIVAANREGGHEKAGLSKVGAGRLFEAAFNSTRSLIVKRSNACAFGSKKGERGKEGKRK